MTSNVVNLIVPPPKYHLPPKTLSVGSLRNVCSVGSISIAVVWAQDVAAIGMIRLILFVSASQVTSRYLLDRKLVSPRDRGIFYKRDTFFASRQIWLLTILTSFGAHALYALWIDELGGSTQTTALSRQQLCENALGHMGISIMAGCEGGPKRLIWALSHGYLLVRP